MRGPDYGEIFSRLIFINYLIYIILPSEMSFASTRAQAAPALVSGRFSAAHTHGYPQEWWITDFSA